MRICSSRFGARGGDAGTLAPGLSAVCGRSASRRAGEDGEDGANGARCSPGAIAKGDDGATANGGESAVDGLLGSLRRVALSAAERSEFIDS